MSRIYFIVILCVACWGCKVEIRDRPYANNQTQNNARAQSNQAEAQEFTPQVQPEVTPLPSVTNNLSSRVTGEMYDIVTTVGTMRMRLYNETPVHRDNFRKLVGERFFDGTTFHRVINNFMIQGGDPNSRDGNPRNDGQGGPPYTLPAEIIPTLYHKRGAIAAARQPDRYNPSRSSNGSQFYIVKGQVFDEATLLEIEDYLKRQLGDPSFIFSNSARNMYTSQGGYPMLDNQYTIFGELVEGYDVLDAISAVQTDGSDRPVEDITIISIRPSRAQ